jgi:hypothetical protein
MLEVIKEAAAVDTRRFVLQAGQHNNDEHLEGVDVLQAGFQTKAYTVYAPVSRCATCTCATAHNLQAPGCMAGCACNFGSQGRSRELVCADAAAVCAAMYGQFGHFDP